MTGKNSGRQVDFLSPLSMVGGLGPKRVAALRESGLATAGDLLYHFPRRYLDRSLIVPLKDIGGHINQTCTVSGTVEKARIERGRRPRLRALLSDGTGSLELLWFAGIPVYRNMLTPGTEILVTGKVSAYRHIQMVHPMIERKTGGGVRPYLPLYSISDPMREAGISHRLLSKAVQSLLGSMARFPQAVPEAIEKKRGFPPLEQCLREIHLPSDLSKLDGFLYRMRYEELFRLALTLRWSRRKFALPGRAMLPGELDGRFRRGLPFVLTEEQEKAVRTLYADAASGRRMHRLLQGDVGSGKTLVAFFAAFPALACGRQVAWLAPTEVLAMQTFGLVSSWLSKLGFRAELLKGGIAAGERRRVLDGLASGEARFVVGTHALLEPQVKFRQLGMIVIDEQHKFGAAQRLAMQEKDTASDFLLMSATPIPQTLAKTLYGDLDIVTILKPPPGRHPVETFCVPESKRGDMERFVLKEIRERGAAVYYVVPRIEHDESLETMRDAETAYAELSKGAFAGIPCGCIHGRMSGDEKERVMKSFTDGGIKLLVSTTVVEVGVDVPHATVMVIENAERFGMAQLHQLRGRVGRGSEKSYCFLLTPSGSDSATAERLSFFSRNHDGFRISEMDLTLRGPGEVAGFRQTGWEDLRLADIVRDAGLFRQIQEEIDALLPC
ncbi:MAG: ATP-dependent DNA helicase RecG [Chitinispirillaceae bacterium]|nr:ATP-dependent DNA helicase RecG [Chitinispirillaceae bacterium]